MTSLEASLRRARLLCVALVLPAAMCAMALRQEVGASFSMMARLEQSATDRQIKQYFSQLSDQDTPYGRVVKILHIKTNSGDLRKIAYCCPFAWLYTIATQAPAFLAFMLHFLESNVARIVFYIDETRPGNILRPDMARAFHSIY